MTLLEIRNQIVSHFIANDTFIIPNHLDKIEVDKHQEPVKLELVQLALADLKEIKFCQAILSLNKEKAVYVLSNPIYADGQNVKISMPTANLIAEIVNAYGHQLGDEAVMTDKMSITDKDIQFLCLIINSLLETQVMPKKEPNNKDEENE